jgi:IS30 family transposase
MRSWGLSAHEQDEVWARWRQGESLRLIARRLGKRGPSVRAFVLQTGGVQRHPPRRAARCLSMAEREEISRGVAAGESCRQIAARLGRASSTVSRELARNGGRTCYRAAVPGHWEGDLLLGKRPSAVVTLVERASRYLTLVALPDGYKAEQVRPALAAAVTQLPEQLRRSLTWDQGKEMAEHIKFTVDTGVTVYFCDPRSPWQRGSNENANGLLRQYLSRGADLHRFDQAALDAIAAELNGRPRQTLGFKTPSEALAEALR